jgi:hypothetical protein
MEYAVGLIHVVAVGVRDHISCVLPKRTKIPCHLTLSTGLFSVENISYLRYSKKSKMNMNKTEIELLRASKAGSAEAFGVIVERYQSLVCGTTYSTTGDLVKSQDLVQESFIRAWKGLGRLKDPDKFRAWLCTCNGAGGCLYSATSRNIAICPWEK